MPDVVNNFLQLLVYVLWGLLIVRVVISWTSPTGGGAFAAFVYTATEPILAPIRRFLPPTRGVDWSPLVAMLLIGIVLRFVTRL